MTTATAKKHSAPAEHALTEDGSGRFRIVGEHAGVMLPPREPGASDDVFSLEALGGMIELEPPPVPSDRPLAGPATVSGVFARGEADTEIKDFGLSDLVTSLRPTQDVERAELDIADLTLSANNPYLASSLVPPAARPFPIAKVASGVLIGFAVAGAAAWLLTHPATVASHTAARAPKQSTQVVAKVAPAVSTETVAKISAQPIQPTNEIATKAAEVPVPTKAPEAVAPIKRVAPVVAEAPVVAATAHVEPKAAAPAAVEPVAAPKAELTAPAATTIAPTPAEPAVLGSEDVALPEELTREQVVAGFESTREALLQCAAGKHGIVTLTTTIANSGRVSRAVVEGVFQGSPEGSCMARAVRSARFQRFSQQSLNVTYPISL